MCKKCKSLTIYSPTSCKDILIRCSKETCRSYVCTIDRCYNAYSGSLNANTHQQQVHRANSDLNKCFFCKTFKDRTTGKESAQCPKCGIFWCLFKDCTFEAVKLIGVLSHSGLVKHIKLLKP